MRLRAGGRCSGERGLGKLACSLASPSCSAPTPSPISGPGFRRRRWVRPRRPSPIWPVPPPPERPTCRGGFADTADAAERLRPQSARCPGRLWRTRPCRRLLKLSGAVRRPTAPAECDSSIRLTVVDRRVVAHDQDVVALTFDGGRRCAAAAWHPGAHLDTDCPAGGCASTRCAVTPPARTPTESRCAGFPTGGGGSVEMHDAWPSAPPSPATDRATRSR